MRLRFRRFAIVFGSLLCLAFGLVRASIYEPDEPSILSVRADGFGEPLPFDEFRRRVQLLNSLRNPSVKNAEGRPTDRDKVIARVKVLEKQPNRTADETAVMAADMIRLGNSDNGFYVDRAINLLAPRMRDRNPNYFIYSAFATAHAVRMEWSEAIRTHEDAQLDCELPDQVKGWTSAQRKWVQRLDRDYVLRYYKIQKADSEARPRPDPAKELPTPLFPQAGKGLQVRFVGDSGKYEPGKLSDAERAKLPPDALAITQQMLLWFPYDTRLLWLLAELYAIDGNLMEARVIMDECVSEARLFSNRTILVEHRAAIRANEASQLKSQVEQPLLVSPDPKLGDSSEPPIDLRTIGIYFGVVVTVAIVALGRALLRKRGSNKVNR